VPDALATRAIVTVSSWPKILKALKERDQATDEPDSSSELNRTPF
jgi:hypothetical protein